VARDALTAIGPADTAEALVAQPYRLLLEGHPAEAARRALAVADELLRQEHYWPRWRAVDALLVAALAAQRASRLDEHEAHLRRAFAAIQQVSSIAATTFYQRRLARIRLMLARLGGRDAAEHASAAAAWYRRAGGYDERVRELEAITGSR
jgi:hypothetical protein